MELHTKSRYGWRWILVLLGGLAWVSIGCSPQTLSALLMPFTDNNTPPECKLFESDKEITLCIMSNFARPELHEVLIGADAELADQLIHAFRKRCQENKHKIKFIPSAQVRSEEIKQRQTGGFVSPVDIGKTLKADYVLEVKINSFSIYEKDTYPQMYRGKTELAVNMYKVAAKDGEEHKLYSKEFPRVYPNGMSTLVADGGLNASMFRSKYLSVVANDIAKMFISYPPEERRMLE